MGIYKYRPKPVTTREGLHGTTKQIEWALKIREDFLIDAAGKGRLWEVRHYLNPNARWWIENRDKLWEQYDGPLREQILTLIAEKRKSKLEKKEHENDTQTARPTKTPISRRRRAKQNTVQAYGRIRRVAG